MAPKSEAYRSESSDTGLNPFASWPDEQLSLSRLGPEPFEKLEV